MKTSLLTQLDFGFQFETDPSNVKNTRKYIHVYRDVFSSLQSAANPNWEWVEARYEIPWNNDPFIRIKSVPAAKSSFH